VSIVAHNLPTGASFDPITVEFAWTPSSDETGNYSITFTAMDAGTPPLDASQTIIIQVRPGPGQICLTCYRTLGLPLDDGVVASLGFLGLISALVATVYVGMRSRGESDLADSATNYVSRKSARGDSLPGKGQFVDWMEDASSCDRSRRSRRRRAGVSGEEIGHGKCGTCA